MARCCARGAGRQRQRAGELLERLGIAELAERRAATLPLGVQKRLEMGRALAIEPRLLLLDEPLAGLNQTEAGRLADLIVTLNQEGLTVVLVEHNLAEVLRIVGRLVVMVDGAVLASGAGHEVMRRADVRAAYLGESRPEEGGSPKCSRLRICIAATGCSAPCTERAFGSRRAASPLCLAPTAPESPPRSWRSPVMSPVSSGDIRLAGESLAAASPVERTRRGIGLVPEGRRVFSDLSVAENLLVGGYIHDRERTRVREARVLALFPRLAERYRQSAGTLSGGEQQMLAIGRALMADPKVLLIDELSLGLMPAVVDQCFAAILDLVCEGVAVLLVEQNTRRALEHADSVLLLVSGNTVYRAEGEEARRDAGLVDTYLGSSEAGQ